MTQHDGLGFFEGGLDDPRQADRTSCGCQRPSHSTGFAGSEGETAFRAFSAASRTKLSPSCRALPPRDCRTGRRPKFTEDCCGVPPEVWLLAAEEINHRRYRLLCTRSIVGK